MVSNAAALGSTGGAFRLEFDVTSVQPCAGHYVYLILWDDANGNDAFDPGEEWKYVIPLYEDRVFLDATDCVYYYDERVNEMTGTAPGWNQSIGLHRFVPVTHACREGARLSNESAWGRQEEARS
jgi:hypothetical protein